MQLKMSENFKRVLFDTKHINHESLNKITQKRHEIIEQRSMTSSLRCEIIIAKSLIESKFESRSKSILNEHKLSRSLFIDDFLDRSFFFNQSTL